jgi:2-oxoglutarate dehydrogenase E2 component (dihydrolipoamide succinyltransferase)
MANFDIIMPKMGESIEEATITNWFVKEGDRVEEDDVLLEIATDKVDSEIPSPVAGTVRKILFKQDEVVAVGTVIAVIDMEGEGSADQSDVVVVPEEEREKAGTQEEKVKEPEPTASKSGDYSRTETDTETETGEESSPEGRFYSPLVRKIAREENITSEELDRIPGSGVNGRVQKNDVLNYLKNREEKVSTAGPGVATPAAGKKVPEGPAPSAAPRAEAPKIRTGEQDEVVPMSRMRKLIAEHMVRSKQTSAHVSNMIEVDVTGVVQWRNRMKDEFLRREGVKLTFLPVFLEATVKTLKEFPQINASVDGDRIILRKNINLGIAVSLPDNNLIVPNIKNADTLNLTGIARRLNELATAARSNKLNPDDISGGTFTVTNFGTFQNDIGTPIINQPELAILAIGTIRKKPVVIETELGDVIAIRQMMWLSLTYDHRIIDGALGGAFLRRLGDYIESFEPATGTYKLS